LCGGKIQGTYAKKIQNCWRCEFMNMVKKEEEPLQYGFSHTRLGMEKSPEKLGMEHTESTQVHVSPKKVSFVFKLKPGVKQAAMLMCLE